jgi:SAM-dependent methyltransferase
MSEVARLNWGCGPCGRDGWINSDRVDAQSVHLVCDVRDGIPLPADHLDYVVSIHALQDLPYLDIVPALTELRRVLKPSGTLRLGLPDLDRAIAAYTAGDRAYFYVGDDEVESIAGKLIVQIVWYGSSRTPFTFAFVRELLVRAGFRNVQRCGFRETVSPHPTIVDLDNRERESFFVEATK